MGIPTVLSFAAAYFSLVLTATVLLRNRNSFVHRAFAVGMALLAAEELARGLGYLAVLPQDVIHWQKRVIAISAITPAAWLAFSVSYARANFQVLRSRWLFVLAALTAAPIIFLTAFRKLLFTGEAFLRGAARWSIPLDWPGRTLQFFLIV